MMARSDGTMPTLNIHRQWVEITPAANRATNPSEIAPAPMFPKAEKVCTMPRACGRVRSGRLSATSVQAIGKIPPAPTPVMKQ